MKAILLAVSLLLALDANTQVVVDMDARDRMLLKGDSVAWDIEVDETVIMISLTNDSFCTNQKQRLALDATTRILRVEEIADEEPMPYDAYITRTSEQRIMIRLAGEASNKLDTLWSLLTDAADYSLGDCRLWTVHEGKYLLEVESIDGYKSLSKLVEYTDLLEEQATLDALDQQGDPWQSATGSEDVYDQSQSNDWNEGH